MKKNLTYFFALLLQVFWFNNSALAQSGCPGCIIDVPASLPDDTIYLSSIVPGRKGEYYDNDMSFRMPKTTTPVNASDPSIPAGLTIDEITINGLSNVPPGLSWEVDRSSYDPSQQTDGCIKICGQPLQAGMYIIEVSATARIAFITQQVTFDLLMLIEPPLSVNDGFTMTNNIGCGETTVSFQNNIISNGQPGYQYFWDFGNGQTSIAEQPADVLYNTPGTYIVKYKAVLDTTGYFLTRVRLTEVECTDLVSAPDIFIQIFDPQGERVYLSTEFTNTNVPIEVSLNMKLETGNYRLEAIDADSGLEFGDDDCAITSFNQLSDGVLSGSGYSLILTILHPTDTIEITDTVYVFAIPEKPAISAASATTFCKGEAVELSASYDTGIQWYMNGEMIDGATDKTFAANESGFFSVGYTSADGCSSISDEVEVITLELPEIPEFANTNNLLSLSEDFPLSNDLSLQWYHNGLLIPNATDLEWCATESGEYTLVITDNITGCENEYSTDVTIDPAFDCTVNTADLANIGVHLNLFPNPTQGAVTLSVVSEHGNTLLISLFDLMGKRLIHQVAPIHQGQTDIPLNLNSFSAGIYLLRIESGGRQISLPIVKQ